MKSVAIVCANDRVRDHVRTAFGSDDSVAYVNLSSIDGTKILADSRITLVMLHLNSFKIDRDVLLEQLFYINPSATIFVLSDLPEYQEATEVINKGAKGYANSRMFVDSMKFAIEAVTRGDIWMPPEYVFELIKTVKHNEKNDDELVSKLTKKEYEVAQLVALGKSNHEIADKLSITDRTVKAHLSAIFEKLNIKDRLSLALLVKNI